MNCDKSPAGRPSPRREVQGPRPIPLKVSKDSYKIKKTAGEPGQAPPVPVAVPQHRPPIIIYTVSPKVIHTDPGDFMSLVQRLTGVSSTSSSSSSVDPISVPSPSHAITGVFSPAARLAAATSGGERARHTTMDILDQLGIDQGGASASHGRSPGFLSPAPSSLPVISSSFFSPTVDFNASLRGFSPASLHGHRNFIESGMFQVNPTYTFPSPVNPSPAVDYWDLFNHYHDN